MTKTKNKVNFKITTEEITKDYSKMKKDVDYESSSDDEFERGELSSAGFSPELERVDEEDSDEMGRGDDDEFGRAS